MDLLKVGGNLEADKTISFQENKIYSVIKRFFDIFLSIIGLFILIWLFIIIAVLIKFEDPKGPIFFSQIRIGKNEKEFKMFKFRSMVVDAEKMIDTLLEKNEVSGAMFKMKEDPRITRVGRFIRRTSIDELPQLLNVLKGEMSLVGPRPPLVREFQQYNHYHRQRLLVKPGCTGLWQVSARNSIGFEGMVDLDLSYMQKQSLLYDLRIIFSTIIIMFRPNSGY